MQMDHYLDEAVTNQLAISPNVSALLKEARGLDGQGYLVWVATVASELILHPAGYAENGYMVPWEDVSEPFLRRVWQKGDPEPT